MPTSSDKKNKGSQGLKDPSEKQWIDMDEAELMLAVRAWQPKFENQSQSLNYAQSSAFKNAAIYTPALSDGYINCPTSAPVRQKWFN